MNAPEPGIPPIAPTLPSDRQDEVTVTPVDSSADFMALLRRIHARSGLTAGQIAASSGLPRSTAYRFINAGNNTLPKHRDQVVAFLRACRLQERAVQSVVRIWELLSGHATSDELATKALQKVRSREIEYRRQRQVIVKNITKQPVLDVGLDSDKRRILEEHLAVTAPNSPAQQAIARQADLLRFLDVERLLREGGVLNDVDAASEKVSPRKQPSPVGPTSWAFRNFVLGLLALTLYPVATSVWFGYHFTTEFTRVMFLVTVVVVLFSTSIWIRQIRRMSIVLSPARVATAVLIAFGAGFLAWAASPTPLVGLLTGFTVFTTTPIWLAITKFTGLRTARGSFVVLTSLWFGATFGFLAYVAEIPVPGAILDGIIGAAAAVMLLSNKILD